MQVLQVFVSSIQPRDLLRDFQLPPLPTFNVKGGGLTVGTNGNAGGVVDKGRPTFAVDLGEQLTRDNVEVPPIMSKCCEAIEKHGLFSQGIYRVSGMTSKVASLKSKLDKGPSAIFETPKPLFNAHPIRCRSRFSRLGSA